MGGGANVKVGGRAHAKLATRLIHNARMPHTPKKLLDTYPASWVHIRRVSRLDIVIGRAGSRNMDARQVGGAVGRRPDGYVLETHGRAEAED